MLLWQNIWKNYSIRPKIRADTYQCISHEALNNIILFNWAEKFLVGLGFIGSGFSHQNGLSWLWIFYDQGYTFQKLTLPFIIRIILTTYSSEVNYYCWLNSVPFFFPRTLSTGAVVIRLFALIYVGGVINIRALVPGGYGAQGPARISENTLSVSAKGWDKSRRMRWGKLSIQALYYKTSSCWDPGVVSEESVGSRRKYANSILPNNSDLPMLHVEQLRHTPPNLGRFIHTAILHQEGWSRRFLYIKPKLLETKWHH